MDSESMNTCEGRRAFAIAFLVSGESPAVLARSRRLNALAAVLELVDEDAPQSLATEDPSRYKQLRDRITELRIAGWKKRS